MDDNERVARKAKRASYRRKRSRRNPWSGSEGAGFGGGVGDGLGRVFGVGARFGSGSRGGESSGEGLGVGSVSVGVGVGENSMGGRARFGESGLASIGGVGGRFGIFSIRRLASGLPVVSQWFAGTFAPSSAPSPLPTHSQSIAIAPPAKKATSNPSHPPSPPAEPKATTRDNEQSVETCPSDEEVQR